MGALFGGRASQLVSLDELWISSSSAANRKLPWQETCFRMSCMGKLSAAQVLFTRECCSSCEWHWCAVIGRATCFNCGLYRGIGHTGLCSAVKETCAYQCAGFARCICVCVCVSVRSWGGDDASVCRLPFIEVPRVAAVFPSPQEMTRRVSGWWIGRARAAEHGSTAHILGIIYPGVLPPGTNGIIITREDQRMMFQCLTLVIPPITGL